MTLQKEIALYLETKDKLTKLIAQVDQIYFDLDSKVERIIQEKREHFFPMYLFTSIILLLKKFL